MPLASIVVPSGPYTSTCGYCSPAGERSKTKSSHHTACLDAVRLSCDVYQRMIDRGWRRSGTYCYKPDLKYSCCPQYTIRLDALAYGASRSHRKLVNRWNRFVVAGKNSEHMGTKAESYCANKKQLKMPPFSLCESIHASEREHIGGSVAPFHNFEVTLEPSSFSKEKYILFQKYQENIHHDTSTQAGFERFLVNSPLLHERIPYGTEPPSHLPPYYGSYHQLYKLDGQLIAMGVIDILPHCVSSVYFMYDDAWEEYSLGKLSALREISLVREMQDAGAPEMNFLYMGFYIHSCQKMRYKAQYSPSYLADPETYEWCPLSRCLPLLEKYRYASFIHPDNSLVRFPICERDESELQQIQEVDLDKILCVSHIEGNNLYTEPVNTSRYWDSMDIRREILACIHALGLQAGMKDVIFTF